TAYALFAIRTRSAHDAGDAARTAARRLDRILEKALRGNGAIAGAQIGPGAAMAVGLACCRARLAARGDRGLERAVVAADAVDRIFGFAERRLDHAGAAHAGDAAARLGARHHFALEPAHRLLAERRRIREAPGSAALVVLAARGTDGRIAARNRG